jgi:hypothetical protein
MTRMRLENRRASETFSFECGGLRYTATISRFDDRRIAEIFLSNTKPSSQSDVNARDSGVAASLAFQFGCRLKPCAELCCAMRTVSPRHRSALPSIS